MECLEEVEEEGGAECCEGWEDFDFDEGDVFLCAGGLLMVLTPPFGPAGPFFFFLK